MSTTFDNGVSRETAVESFESFKENIQNYLNYGFDSEAVQQHIEDNILSFLDFDTFQSIYDVHCNNSRLTPKELFKLDEVKTILDNSMNLEYSDNCLEGYEEAAEIWNHIYAHGSWYDYGLDFSFVDAGTFDDQTRGYYRYQISWGGPSTELRIYNDDTIEWVHLDWFSGHGLNVSNDEVMKQLVNLFKELQSIDWNSLDPEQIEIYEYDEYDEE